MKKLLCHGVPFALSTLAVCAAQVAHAAPSGGAYQSDARNTWVQDRVGDRIGTVNMIMCIIGSMRGDAMVNQGAYVALIDQNKCEGRGDSSKSTSTSAGASNATDYMSAVVNATQASESSPLVIKAWISQEEDMGNGPEKMTIHAHVNARAGQTAEHPNGLFEMYFCGRPDSQTDAHGGSLEDCVFRGSLQSSENGISFFEQEADHGHGSQTTRLVLNSTPGTDAGSGRISGADGGSPYDYTFAYNSSQFCRSDGSAETCFNRDDESGEYSTWRYGTYNSDGSRLEVANPGFPVKFIYSGKTYYGFWGFWGLSLPEAALANLANGTLTRHVGEADVPLTTEQHGGKLWKLTRKAATLDEVKNVSMMFWTQQSVGALQAGTNYEVKWNGTALQAVSKNVCDGNGCSPQPLTNPIDIDADDLRAAYVKALPVFFQAGGGNGTVNVPDAGEFLGGTDVFYRVRDTVKPGDPDLHLDCVTQCLLSGASLTTALASNQTPFAGNWGPTGTLHSYTFSGGDLTHDGNGHAAVDASGVAKDHMGSYMWGLNSGAMVAHAEVDSVKCNNNGVPNTSGLYYCPGLVDKAAVIYQWETGPNQWNQYFGAVGVTIDPPKNLTLAAHYGGVNHSGNTIFGGAASAYDGNSLQLQNSGFGELQGIPGGCVDPDTNATVPCSQNARWVPAFNIADGAGVSDGTATYYVRYMERELRLSTVARTGASPTLPSTSLALPDATLISVNARTQNGTLPTPANPEPAVIDGTVQ
jgi:hypothetical protein